MTFTLQQLSNNKSELIMNSNKAAKLKLDSKKQAYISFGNRNHYVSIKMSETQAEDIIMLSCNVINNLLLPDFITFEIRIVKNEIILGPYIGLLLRNHDETLDEIRLEKMLMYVMNYSNLSGAVVVFALDKVDTIKKIIKGYCYNPISDCWQIGIFPYPCAVYRTIGLNNEWKNHFLSTIGDRLFNNQYFNKRQMHSWFSDNKTISFSLKVLFFCEYHKL